MANQPELKLMQECYTYWHNNFHNLRGILWRVENERKRTKYQQSIAKSTGLTAGVSDFNLLYKDQFYAIELKANVKGKQSKKQKQWQTDIEAQGGKYCIIHSLEQFKGLIHEILNV